MRKIFTGILLAASLPAFADIAADLSSGKSVQEAYQAASAECGGNCDEQIFADMLAAGVAVESITQAALASGADVASVMSAATKAGVSVADAGAAVQQAAGNLGMDVAAVDNAVTSFITNQPATAAGNETQQPQLPALPPVPEAPAPLPFNPTTPDDISPV